MGGGHARCERQMMMAMGKQWAIGEGEGGGGDFCENRIRKKGYEKGREQNGRERGEVCTPLV